MKKESGGQWFLCARDLQKMDERQGETQENFLIVLFFLKILQFDWCSGTGEAFFEHRIRRLPSVSSPLIAGVRAGDILRYGKDLPGSNSLRRGLLRGV